MLLQRSSSRICRKKHKSRVKTDDSITKYAHNSQAQRVFKTAPLFAQTNPDPTAPQTVIDAFTAFFESLWAPSTNPDGSTVQKAGMSYVYDEDGTLIAQTLTGGAQTSWGQSARYIYLPTASGPMPVAAIYGTKHYAIQSDHLNTPRRLIQSDGQVAWQRAYSAFGEEKPTIAKNRFANADLNQSFGSTTVPAVTFNLRYPGQYYDQESNLHYNYHRSYSATTGRYTQSDPIGLDGGWNRFNYAELNPLSFTDPLGLKGLASPSIGDPLSPTKPIPGGNRGDNTSEFKICETAPIPTWLCEKCIQAFCSSSPIMSTFCCEAEHKKCVIDAAEKGISKEASNCAAKFMTCSAFGGRGNK